MQSSKRRGITGVPCTRYAASTFGFALCYSRCGIFRQHQFDSALFCRGSSPSTTHSCGAKACRRPRSRLGNRPDKINAMNRGSWREIIEIFCWPTTPTKCGNVLSGRAFFFGIDLMPLAQVEKPTGQGRRLQRRCPGAARFSSCRSSFNTVVDNCRKPVLAAIQGCCSGGARPGLGP